MFIFFKEPELISSSLSLILLSSKILVASRDSKNFSASKIILAPVDILLGLPLVSLEILSLSSLYEGTSDLPSTETSSSVSKVSLFISERFKSS